MREGKKRSMMSFDIMHLYNSLKELRGSEIFSAQNPVKGDKETGLICKVKNFLLVYLKCEV